MTETKVNRFVRGYSTSGDNLIEEYPIDLSQKGISVLVGIFNAFEDKNLYECYPLMYSEEWAVLVTYGGLPNLLFDRVHLDYFLEADATN